MGLVNLTILVDKIKKKLSGDFVTKTDYASTSAGGVIKLDSTYATDITSGGKLKAKEISASDYASANDGAFVSKGTLDNLITAGTLGGGVTVEQLAQKTASDNTAKTLTPANPISGYAFIDLVVFASEGFGLHNYIPVSALSADDINLQIPCGLYYRGSNATSIFVFYYKTDGTIVTGTTGNAFACELYGIK